MFSVGNERHSRTWRITAHFSLSEHGMIYDSRLQYLPDYIGSILTSRLHRMQTIQNSMKSITLLSFTYPRQFRGNAESVPVNVILHFSNSIGFLTIQALLNTSGITVTCTPVDFGAGKPCPDVRLHPIFASFLRTSSKDTGPAVNPDLYVRVDIMGNCDAWQATTAADETKCRSWAFDALLDPLIHPALVSDRHEVAADSIKKMLNMDVVNGLIFFSFAMPQDRSSTSDYRAVPVTGVLNSKEVVRLRTVSSIFPADIHVIWKPIRSGRGISFTTTQVYTDYLAKCTKEKTESSDATNPDFLIRVDVKGGSDDVHPKKKGPTGPRKPMQLLDTDMLNTGNMSLPGIPAAVRKHRGSGSVASGRSACSLDETATPPPTPPAAAPRLASAPSVIPRRQPAPHTHRRRPAAQPCRRVPD